MKFLFTTFWVLICFIPRVQAQELREPKYFVSAGVSVNPWLAAQYQELELGPTIILSRVFSKKWEAGVGFLSRGVIYYPENQKYGYGKNLTVEVNREQVWFVQMGYQVRRKRWEHGFYAQPGIRHVKYEENLKIPELGLDETYKLNETRVMGAFAYQLRYKLPQKQALNLRAMIPVNRNPRDDINRYSLELAYQLPLW